MKEYVYTGSEQSLEELVMWWATLPQMNYFIQANTLPSPREFFQITFVDPIKEVRVEITEPHRFTYDGETVKVEKI